MVPSVTTNSHARARWESIFSNAFTPARQAQYQTTTPIETACGDTLNPNFAELTIWSNNVNTLSLSHELADLHELCCQWKENNIGIAALQELNIDLTQASIYQRVKAVLDEHFNKQCILICSSTHLRSATSWKPGSTLLVVLPK
jgi:hypothetical protein